ncbi:restriction endonuclease subunit S [Escherichia coli]|nr:restriction endonuclease subunit S [Escherichia coli]MCF7322180.1 restriction endonuclease subunit S [Escherichia coli]MCR6696287.1 restriction endonuclease subunit S [Escherichia coli]MCU9656069.1 restriction endonuclease subunit S [Escherichia coli]MDF8889347.1 restriction endonuclease subunit S [Escherichia coli]MDY8601456.1 restriction endonuclease subunit S [Escherichia coli]
MSWPMVKLGEIFTISRGGSPRPIQDYITDSCNGVNWIMIGDTEPNSKYIRHTAKKIKFEGVKKSRKVYPGDLLLTNSMSFGRPYILDVEGCIHDGWLVLSPKNNQIHIDYFYHYLNSPTAKIIISNKAAGAVVKNLNSDIVRNLEIPFPPFAEQVRIASTLDKADGIRQKREQAIKLADDFLRATFLEMFGDPVQNPKGWNVKPLADQIIHANNGISRRRKEDTNEGDIVLRLQDVHYSGITFDKELNRIKLVDKEKQIARVEYDDLLFIRVNGNPNYVGRTAVFKSYIEPVYHNDHLIRIKLDNEYQSDFLCYLINSPFSRKLIAQQIKTSAGQHTISQDGILKLMFYRPPIELQEKFINIKNKIESIFYRKDKHEDLFASISNKLIHSIK